jgi:hypothetical protein
VGRKSDEAVAGSESSTGMAATAWLTYVLKKPMMGQHVAAAGALEAAWAFRPVVNHLVCRDVR